MEQAHAKINLALAVGPPEGPRGYHPIASLFACVSLAGDVQVDRVKSGEAAFSTAWAADAIRPSPIDWPVEKDLCWRAWRALEKHVGRELPARIDVRKRVPVGGGLGGGSSEAAAVLRGVNTTWDLGLSSATLASIGATLGADVPFFLDNTAPARPAMVEGFGERLTRVRLPAARVVLFVMPFGCATGPVYQCFDGPLSQGGGGQTGLRAERVTRLLAEMQTSGCVESGSLFNDLALPAMVVEPALAGHAARIGAASGSIVHVTGSGSTLFAIAHDQDDEQRLLKAAGEGVRGLAVDVLV